MFEYVQEKEFSKRLEPRTLVYVIAHGEVEKEHLGKLTERGRNQIYELARSRLVAGVRTLYSSSSKDAIETSDILRKEFECRFEKRDCLADIKLGFSWNDEEKVRNVIPSMWRDENFSSDNGESLSEARERIGDCMNELAAKHPADSIAIVTHPIITNLFFSLVTAAPLSINEWLMTGYASCASYEYAKTGWTLLMAPDNSFQSNPSSVADLFPEDMFV